MRILKDGDLSRLQVIKTFECKKCGCVFEAGSDEFKTFHSQKDGYSYSIECPCCKGMCIRAN